LDYGEFSYKSPYEVANHSAIQAFHVYLFEQIATGNSAVIDDLVSSGIPADLADDSSTADTTLHWAISFNNIDVARTLLNLGVPVDISNNQGKTCLHLACEASNALLIELLLNWGADVSLEDDSGKIAEDYVKEDMLQLKELLHTPVEQVMTSPTKLKRVALNDHEDSREKDTAENVCEDHRQEGVAGAERQTGRETPPPLSREEEVACDSAGSSYVVLDGTSTSTPLTPEKIQSSDDSDTDSQDVTNPIFRNIESEYNDRDDRDNPEDECASDATAPSCSSASSESSSESSSEQQDSPHLILWPPAQRQVQHDSKHPYVIRLDRPLLISCDGDLSAVLSSTRLISTLTGVGVQTAVQTTGSHAGSHVRLCIDRDICPGRHSFDVHVDHHSIRLIAADDTGLLYAINTFVQILKLHSDYITNPPTPGSESNSLIVNFIKIPSMTIHDWPNVSNRGVLWSYPRDTRTKYDHMKDFVVFMSEVRLNQLFVRIDCDERETGSIVSPLTSQDEDENTDEKENTCAELDEYSLELIELDTLSQEYFVEFVPTVVFTSMTQKIPKVVLKRRFRCTTVALTFYMNIDENEQSSARKTSMTFVHNTCQDLVDAGYKSVILFCSETDFETSLVSVAVDKGLNIVMCPTDHFVAESALSRSIMSTKSCAEPFIQRAKDVLNVKRNSVALLPTMAASDFYYPIILLKHMCFLHAGASWNHVALEDILGSCLDDHSLLRPALSTLLFQTYNPSDADTDNSEEIYQNAMLDIFTSSADRSDLPISSSFSSQTQLTEHEHYSEGGSPGKTVNRSAADIEGTIWSLLTATDSWPDMDMPVSKEEAIHTLKRTKRILSAVNWKVIDSKNKSVSMEESNMNISMLETEEFMRMLHLVNIVCRTIVMSYNSAQKPPLPFRPVNPHPKPRTNSSGQFSPSPPCFESLLDSLSPGTSSDLANAILEAMTLCGSVWEERFAAQYFTSSAPGGGGSREGWQLSAVLEERYMRVQRAELPLLAVFGAICKHMPAFSPQVLMKVFDEGVVTDLPVRGAAAEVPPASRGWSLWG
jgi:hypothetical protein